MLDRIRLQYAQANGIAAGRNAVYLDFERTVNANKLRDPEVFFELNSGKFICPDEIRLIRFNLLY